MEIAISYKPNPLISSSSTQLLKTPKSSRLLLFPTKYSLRVTRKKPIFRVYASESSSSENGDGFSWVRLKKKIGESLKKETGFDSEEVSERVKDSVEKSKLELNRIKSEVVPLFIDWNTWEHWKDIKNWDGKRVAALVVYAFALLFSCRGVYVAIQAPRIERERREVTESFMEALIPEPSPDNVEKFKRNIWRKTTPKGLKLKRFIEAPDGTLVHDSSYIGEKAWDDDLETPEGSLKKIIDRNARIQTEAKKKLSQDLGVSGEVEESVGTWRDRLATWKEMLESEKLSELLKSSRAKYVVEFDMKEVEKSLRKDVIEKTSETEGTRALWISKRWWRYRPKLPYTYFLQKLDSSEVAAVVFTEDLKRLYVTMNEGFPLEYIVSENT